MPAALAPAAVIETVPDGDERTDVTLSALVTGGLYDALDYLWSVSGGTLSSATATSPVWSRPAVSAGISHAVTLTVTARGTGTFADDGTTDTAGDTETTTVRNVNRAPMVAWTLRFPASGDAYWSGAGAEVIDDVAHKAVGHIVSIESAEAAVGDPARLALGIDATDPTLMAALMQDSGPVEVHVGWVWSADSGATWNVLAQAVRGFLSSPAYADGLYRMVVEERPADIDRGRTGWWSDESQQRRHPGDTGFSRLAALARGLPGSWPPTSTS